MAGIYLDTSALGRVLLAEPDADPIREAMARYDAWWSSELLIVELRRLATREGLEQAGARMLGAIGLMPVESESLERASRIPPITVRSLDAIHLDAIAQLHGRGEIETALTYDHQLQEGCAHHGVSVLAPSAD